MPSRHALAHAATSLALAAVAASLAFTSLGADAALVARDLDGDTTTAEAFHDTTLGITWLRNAEHLPQALGLAGSEFTQANAQLHLATLNATSSANYGFTSWRLPTALGVHSIGGPGCQSGFDGSTDCGHNVNVASSELAHLFHSTLGNLSSRDAAGNFRPGTGGADWGLVNEADFDNLVAGRYWSSEASYRLIFNNPQPGHVAFNLQDGSQSVQGATSLARAWLVHDGDIGGAVTAAAVLPLPGSAGLMALGLVCLGAAASARPRPQARG